MANKKEDIEEYFEELIKKEGEQSQDDEIA